MISMKQYDELWRLWMNVEEAARQVEISMPLNIADSVERLTKARFNMTAYLQKQLEVDCDLEKKDDAKRGGPKANAGRARRKDGSNVPSEGDQGG